MPDVIEIVEEVERSRIGILIVAAVGIIGFLLTAGIAFGIAGSYQID